MSIAPQKRAFCNISGKTMPKMTKEERAEMNRRNGKLGGRPPGSQNDEPHSLRAQTARQALRKIGDAEVFVSLFNKALKLKDLGTCYRIATYLYDQAYGKAPEQDQPAGGTPVRVVIGWDPSRGSPRVAIESRGAADIAIKAGDSSAQGNLGSARTLNS